MLRLVVAIGALHLAILSLSTTPASASDGWMDIYSCGGSSGHSYFTNGEGWTQDAISQGVIILRKKGTEYDILIGDSVGRFSAREDGAQLIARESEGLIQVLAYYPTMTIEAYLFTKPVKGRSTVAWTSSKSLGIAERVSAFVSTCISR